MSKELQKSNIEVLVKVAEKTMAMPEPSLLKMYIQFTLLKTFPHFNNNAETYDFETTKEKANTISNGYINYRHEPTINIGSVLDSNFIEDEDDEGGRVRCTGVLWKDVMDTYAITPEDVKSGYFKVSMEVFYKDFYYYYDGEMLDPMDNYHLAEYVGSQYKGKFVGKVIVPYEFSGVAITPSPADVEAKIEKAIAENRKNKEGNDNMFKEFETEEQFNEFKTSLAEEMKEDIKAELKENEDFLNEIRNGYVSVAEVLDKFKDVELEGEDLEGVVKSVAEVKENFETINNEYEEFKKTVAEEKLLKKRVAELEQFGYELEDGEDKEIVAMSDEAFNMVKKTAKKAFDKATAEINNDNKEEGFNPNNVNLNDDSELDIVKTFIN